MPAFDMNLIKVFTVLYESGTVTAAAERLFVTQPSVSYSLGKLREYFDDPLFVRTVNGMKPTHLAESLYSGFREAERAIELSIAEAKCFDPITSSRGFRIALCDIGEMVLLPQLFDRLHKLSPNIAIEVIPLHAESFAHWLKEGSVDAAINRTSPAIPGIIQRKIGTEQYGCLVRGGHTRITETLVLSREQFLAEKHLHLSHKGNRDAVDEELLRLGFTRHITLRVSHFSVIPKLIGNSDLIAVLPLSAARFLATTNPEYNLKVLDLPFEIPPFSVSLYWHSRCTRSSSLLWLLEQTENAIQNS